MIRKAFFAFALLLPVLAGAQQYRWIDKDGRVQFSDAPPPPGARDVRRNAPGGKPAAPAPAPEPPLPFELQRLQKDFPVTLYSAPNCKEGCEQARSALNRRGVPFKEVSVRDQQTNDELRTVSGGADVPTLVVGRSVQRGFEQGAFDGLLDSAGYPKAGVYPARNQKAPQDAPAAEAKPPAAPAEPAPKAGPYDTSGLKGPPPKPGIYDPSGLTGPPPKPGQYGIPGEATK